MTDRSLCRHYHPIRYAWHCAVGLRAPRDCHGCTRYDADPMLGYDEDRVRLNQWIKAHDKQRMVGI